MNDLICYVQNGWNPNIRPALRTRQWMDETPRGFAYRCLPLSMANSHGWEVLNDSPFEVVWDGGQRQEAITIRALTEDKKRLPVSIFGSGILTFHVGGLFRTPPEWNLWVTGSPNYYKDGIVPLTGLVETDWSVMTFTMNWKITRPGVAVTFEKDDPICFFFPVQRGLVESFEPKYEEMTSDPDLRMKHTDWAQSRHGFLKHVVEKNPGSSADRWQKHYFQGTDVDGNKGAETHQTKMHVRPFQEK